MARALCERAAKKQHLEELSVFDSAGLDLTDKVSPTVEIVTFLRGERINIAAHRGKPLTVPLIDGADVIFCMTRDLTERAKKFVGEEYREKVVLYTEGIDLATKNPDFVEPANDSVQAYRQLYAALTAAAGRLVRTLEEPNVKPEYFGAKTIEKKIQPQRSGGGPRAGATTIDPNKRIFLANFLFDYLERSFEPPTTAILQEVVNEAGHELSSLEVDEILKQDLHNYVRVDRDGSWHVVPGANDKRRDEAKAQARARAQADKAREQNKAASEKLPDEELTESVAYEVLGATKTTSFDEAQKKYRALLKRYHPDKFHDDVEFREMAEGKARRINAAWLMLKDKFDDID